LHSKSNSVYISWHNLFSLFSVYLRGWGIMLLLTLTVYNSTMAPHRPKITLKNTKLLNKQVSRRKHWECVCRLCVGCAGVLKVMRWQGTADNVAWSYQQSVRPCQRHRAAGVDAPDSVPCIWRPRKDACSRVAFHAIPRLWQVRLSCAILPCYYCLPLLWWISCYKTFCFCLATSLWR